MSARVPALLLALCSGAQVCADEIAPQTSAAVTLPAMTAVELELGDAVYSRTARPGQRFRISVVEDVLAGGVVVIPAGSSGEGEVVHAEKARRNAKAGELILAARYVRVGDDEVQLHSFKLSAAAGERAEEARMQAATRDAAFAAGWEILFPLGTRASAMTTADVKLPARADEPAIPTDVMPSALPATASGETWLLPALTPVNIRIEDPVSSESNRRGDRFRISVTADVRVDGRVVIPAGSAGEGEVVHAVPHEVGGMAGELVLAARFVRVGETRVGLRSLTPVGSGKDETSATAWAIALLSPTFAGGYHGGEMLVPARTPANAKTAAATRLSEQPAGIAATGTEIPGANR